MKKNYYVYTSLVIYLGLSMIGLITENVYLMIFILTCVLITGVARNELKK